MTLTSVPVNLNTYDPTSTMTALVSLEPMAALAFLGLFPSAGATHKLRHLLMFPRACPCLLRILSPFDTGLYAYFDEVAGGPSPMVRFLDMAFNPHNDTTMITVPDNPNGFSGALNTHGGTFLPLLTFSTTDTKNFNVSFMTWVPPCCMHLFTGCRLSPGAALVAGITAVENCRTHAQAQAFVD